MNWMDYIRFLLQIIVLLMVISVCVYALINENNKKKQIDDIFKNIKEKYPRGFENE